jgi:hypothetical protein
MGMILSDHEWAVLREMARSLYANAEKHEGGYCWTVGDTLVDSEVALLKKLAGDFDEFRRQVYLASEPSVDITKVESVDCREHTIPMSEYIRLKEEYGIGSLQANSWMLCSGPKVIDGKFLGGNSK